jgi:hypothetical protein
MDSEANEVEVIDPQGHVILRIKDRKDRVAAEVFRVIQHRLIDDHRPASR